MCTIRYTCVIANEKQTKERCMCVNVYFTYVKADPECILRPLQITLAS